MKSIFKSSNCLLYLALLLIIISLKTYAEPLDEPPKLIGHSLFNPDYSDSTEDLGDIHHLTPNKRNTLNIKNSADLLSDNIGFFFPDLVSAGREAYLSTWGCGIDDTRLYWNSRPFRSLPNLRSDFRFIPPGLVGSVKSTYSGSIDGMASPGGSVSMQPLSFHSDIPLTYLHHRDGYYGFAPVEFYHLRRVSKRSYISAGGLIPSSGGRFGHSAYSGRVLTLNYQMEINRSLSLNLNYLSGLNNIEIPFNDTTSTIDRNDIDLGLSYSVSGNLKLDISTYRSEEHNRFDEIDGYGREAGIVSRLRKGNTGLSLRYSNLSGVLTGGKKYNIDETEGALSLTRQFGEIRSFYQFGFNGWLPDRIRPNVLAGVDIRLYKRYYPFFTVKQVPAPQSPEAIFANYTDQRPLDEFQPVWNSHAGLPIIGHDLPVTIRREVESGLKTDFGRWNLTLSAQASYDIHPFIWAVKQDTLITPVNISSLSRSGLKLAWSFTSDPYRASIAALEQHVRRESEVVMKPEVFKEPEFRAQWEVGWHKFFYNNAFETDISLSGRYFSSYYNQDGTQKLGGAYPLDLRLSARISRFTLQYGVHNWNSYQYWLTPKYKMLHKEEYWEISWLLLD